MDQFSSTSSERAATPFDQGGDVILRSSDKVDFRVYKVILSFASPFFKDMFSLEQPVGSGADVPASDADMHVVEMTEDKGIIDCLLRYIYPIPDSYIGSLGVLERVLEAALKYDLTQPIHLSKQRLHNFIRPQPLHAYAVCCRLECETEARMAAQFWKMDLGTLRNDIDMTNWSSTLPARSFVPRMENISAGAFARLLRYARGEDVFTFCRNLPVRLVLSQVDSSVHWDATRVSQTPPFNRPDADLAIQSVDGIVFPVHRLLLELHTSPTANSLLQRPVVPPMQPAELPLIQFEERSDVLEKLLQLCYPPFASKSAHWSLDELSDPLTMRVMHAAVRYGLSSVVERYKEHWRHYATDHPARLYRTAYELGWPEEARVAAENLATRRREALEALETDDFPAGQYICLLKFIHQCQQVIFSVIGASTSFGSSRWKEMLPAAVQWSSAGSSEDYYSDEQLRKFLVDRNWDLGWSDYPRLAVAYHSSRASIKEAIAKVRLGPLASPNTLTLRAIGQRLNCRLIQVLVYDFVYCQWVSQRRVAPRCVRSEYYARLLKLCVNSVIIR